MFVCFAMPDSDIVIEELDNEGTFDKYNFNEEDKVDFEAWAQAETEASYEWIGCVARAAGLTKVEDPAMKGKEAPYYSGSDEAVARAISAMPHWVGVMLDNSEEFVSCDEYLGSCSKVAHLTLVKGDL